MFDKEDVISEAMSQGYAVNSLSAGKLGAFVLCVLGKCLYMPLPAAVAECAKNFF